MTSSNTTEIAELAAQLRVFANDVSIGDVDEGFREIKKLSEDASMVQNRSSSSGSSCVLVLVDAHSHPFINGIFIKSSDQSYPALNPGEPVKIGHRLLDPIKRYLIETHVAANLRAYRLVVRVYADSTKHELLRRLQQFPVHFSSVDVDFHFISVLNEARVEFTVTNVFQTACYDQNYKHVFFAAWRRPEYLAMLRTSPKKVTLVQGKGMGAGAEYVPLPCGSISIPEIFSKPSGQDTFLSLTSHSIGKQLVKKLIRDKTFCEDDLRGPQDVASSCNTDIGSTASNGATDTHRQPVQLPRLLYAVPGHVPVNINGQRLDYYTQRPSPADRQAYFDKYTNSELQPCKWFHLANACHFQGACTFDHSEVSYQVHKVIEYMVRRKPCNMGSDCRRIDCINGHICQDTRCSNDGLETCSMKRFHAVEPEFASWSMGKHASEFPTGFTK